MLMVCLRFIYFIYQYSRQIDTVFRFDFAPTYIVGGVYIQAENSKYFSPNMFAELDSLLSRCIECDYIPFIGGDFNSRLGDLNLLSKSWHYSKNVDVTTNIHGRTFMTDVCKRNDTYPINHLKYKCTNFGGDFTYIKNEKKSQIDFTLTNSDGRNHITSFSIINQDWHISDHRPVCVDVCIDCTTSSNSLLVRAENLNYEFSPDVSVIQRFNKSYNLNVIDDYIESNCEILYKGVSNALQNDNINLAVHIYNEFMNDMHRRVRAPNSSLTHNNNINNNVTILNEANSKFKKYCECLISGNSQDIKRSLNEYH